MTASSSALIGLAVEMSPEAVHARLERLRELYVPETVEQGRARLEAERPPRRETFNEAAARRLEELRALYALAKVLQNAPRRDP